MRAEGTVISSTPSDDVDMITGQNQETVPGSRTHLDGVVVQERTKVKISNVSEKVSCPLLLTLVWCSCLMSRSTKKRLDTLGNPTSRDDSGGSGVVHLLCSCKTPLLLVPLNVCSQTV